VELDALTTNNTTYSPDVKKEIKIMLTKFALLDYTLRVNDFAMWIDDGFNEQENVFCT
jgi:hypothetical protein